MTILSHPVVPWFICAAVAGICGWLIYDLEKQRKTACEWLSYANGELARYQTLLGEHVCKLSKAEEELAAAEEARDAYREALAQARWRRQAGRDWRDSHLETRVADENALTRVWEKPL